MDDEGRFWWCRKHERVETADERCRARHLLGPYATEEAARNWKERFEAREERWEEQDEEWEGEDADDSW